MNFFDENVQFSRLIQFYAWKLGDNSAVWDLWGFLFALKSREETKKPDKYYAVCIRNEFLRLRKENAKKIVFQHFSDRFANLESTLEVRDLFEKLTKKESQVLRLHYIGGYSIDDIGKICKTSRQAINKTKNRGLAKLRQLLLT